MKDDNNSVAISGNFDSDSTTISIANQSDTVNGPCVLELDNNYQLSSVDSSTIIVPTDAFTLKPKNINLQGDLLEFDVFDNNDAFAFKTTVKSNAFINYQLAQLINNNQKSSTAGRIVKKIVQFVIEHFAINFSTHGSPCSCGGNFEEETIACLNVGGTPKTTYSPRYCHFTCNRKYFY